MHLVVLRAYLWLRTQGLLLEGIMAPYGMTWVSPSAGKSLSAELSPREVSLDSISLPFQPYLGTQVRTQMFPRPHQKTEGQEKQSTSTSLDVSVVIGGMVCDLQDPKATGETQQTEGGEEYL